MANIVTGLSFSEQGDTKSNRTSIIGSFRQPTGSIRKLSIDDTGRAVSIKYSENRAREQWSNKLDFILSCLGYAVGLGNLWRFPTIAYESGGGAFFIPYFIFVATVALPMMLLELGIGQFCSLGPTLVWEVCPIAKGIGYASVIISTMISTYYNMVIAWAIYYMGMSFYDELPWAKCGDWSTKKCYLKKIDITESGCRALGGIPCGAANNLPPCSRDDDDACLGKPGTCQHNDSLIIWDLKAFYQDKHKNFTDCKLTMPAMEYYARVGIAESGYDLNNVGSLKWQMVLCLAIAWFIVAACLANGIKVSGKVVWVTALLPYAAIVGFFINGLFLTGHGKGIEYYLKPDFSKLGDMKVWKEAAKQIFFGCSLSQGGLMALASYNKFTNNIWNDSLIVVLGNAATSVFAGFAVFSYLGYMANELGMDDVGNVAEKGVALVFGVYAAAIATLPAPQFVNFVFFFMILLLGIDSQFVVFEVVIIALLDTFPRLRDQKFLVVIVLSGVFFLLGLPMCVKAGPYVLDVYDTYVTGWNSFLIAIGTSVAVGWAYGAELFLKDLELMLGKKFNKFWTWYYWVEWKFICPVIFVPVLLVVLISYEPKKGHPTWATTVGWLMTCSSVFLIFGCAIHALIKVPGPVNMVERFKVACTATKWWGPALIDNRMLAFEYNQAMVINPEKEPTLTPRMSTNIKIIDLDKYEEVSDQITPWETQREVVNNFTSAEIRSATVVTPGILTPDAK